MQKKIEKMQDFLHKESKKRGFESVVFGLSGGIDSAVVGKLCVNVFGSKAKALIMPSFASNPKNTQDAVNFARSINLQYEIIDISHTLQSFVETLNLYKTPDFHRIGNISARIRMITLFDKSILHNALVIGCSNKSEIMLGYGTIFGDLACGINPIGGLFKSEIFTLAKKLDIPSYIISKKPSADLYAGQSDEGDLGYSYSDIDKILKQIQKGASAKTLIDSGFNKKFVESIFRRVKKNAFKSEMPKILTL